MPDQPDLDEVRTRLSKLEIRVDQVAADATAARHLAAANDRDYGDIALKVDANRGAINALGVQTATRIDRLETEMRAGFERLENEMRFRFDQQAAGQQAIVDLITRVLDDREQS